MPGADFALAFSAGAISFLSPCVLPLVPVYLSVTTGLGVAELSQRGPGRAATVARGAGLFILGFSVVFVALGLSATAVGGALLARQVPITRVAGLVVILMALAMLAGTTARGLWVTRERRFHPDPVRHHMWVAPVTGAAFAFGWTPCIGPILAGILVVAGSKDTIGEGVLLLAVYSLGLGVPFLLTSLAIDRFFSVAAAIRRHYHAIELSSGGLLVAIGLLIFTGQLTVIVRYLQPYLPVF